MRDACESVACQPSAPSVYLHHLDLTEPGHGTNQSFRHVHGVSEASQPNKDGASDRDRPSSRDLSSSRKVCQQRTREKRVDHNHTQRHEARGGQN